MRANRLRLFSSVSAVVLLVTIGDSGCGGKDKRASSTSGEKPVALSPYSNIYVVDVANRKVRPLTDNHLSELAQTPAWSAQGTIAFTQAICDECISKLTLARPGSGKTTVVKGQPKHVFQPTWSPDGRKIALVRLGFGLYSVDLRAGKSVRLTDNQAHEAPAWSPDGNRIIFDAQISGSNWDLLAVDRDGHGLRRVTRGPLQETNPAWSPNGSMIAYARQARNGNWVIQRMKASGGGRFEVTNHDVSSQEPAWSPDGSRIAYVEQVGARAYLSVISVRGGKPRRLTGNSLVAARPSWSPDGKEIVFSAKAASADPSKFPEVEHGEEGEGGREP
jgi:Tol biopolymer transport system component